MDKQLTPEEILDKHLSKSDDIWEVSDLKKAMEEYASQYNRVYNQNLERLIRERDRFSQQTAALQSRVVVLESSLNDWMEIASTRLSRIAELERENERRLGLLELMHTRYLYTYLQHQSYGVSDKATFVESDWQSYCKEHNLKPTD